VQEDLERQGSGCSVNRIARLMAEEGLKGKSPWKFRKTTIANPKLDNSPNLLKDQSLPPERPRSILASDITYIPTREGWMYLCVVLDLCSRKVIGWSIQPHMRATLVHEALKGALYGVPEHSGVIFHSDCGGQYKSNLVRKFLKRNRVRQSMTNAGTCYDNAYRESFFEALKSELDQRQFSTRKEAESTTFEYVEVFYNRQNLHSSLGYQTPEEYEENAAWVLATDHSSKSGPPLLEVAPNLMSVG
jgi:putative transposase